MKFNLLAFAFLLATITIQVQAQTGWKKISIGTTSQLNSIAFADDTRYGMIIGNSGTIFKTIDGGQTWKKLTSGTSKNLKDIQYLDSLNAFVITVDSTLYTTKDGGKTWNTKIVPHRGISLTPHFTNENNGLIFTVWNGIQRTTDGGNNWSLTLLNDNFTSNRFINKDTGFYCSNFNGIFKTKNRGISWTKVKGNSGTSEELNQISFNNNNIIILNNYGVFYSKNQGDTWSKSALVSTKLLKSSTFINSNLLFIVGATGQIVVSSDGGINWTPYTSPTSDNLNCVQKQNNTKGFAVGDNGTVLQYNLPSTTTWSGLAWSDGLPDSTRTIILASNYNTAELGELKARKIIINPNIQLIADDTKGIHIKDSIVNNGKIIIKNAPITFTHPVIGNKIDQEIQFLEIPDLKIDSKLTLTPFVGSGLPVSISISNDNVTLINNEVSGVKKGSTSITADQEGDVNFNAAKSFTRDLKVLNADTTIKSTGVRNWFENYPSATVLTFDDFSPGHPAIGIPYLISRKLPGSFYVTIQNAWRVDDYQIMMNAVNNGIEIGNHTYSHPHLPQSTPANMIREINDVCTTINQNVTNQKCYTFAYPFGEYNDTVINVVKQKHIAARTVYPTTNGWSYNFALTENDYFTIPTFEVAPFTTKDDFAQAINDGISGGGLLTFMIHSIYGPGVQDQWFDAITSDFYGQILDTLQTYKDKTWITTFSNAVRYHKEANSAKLEVIANDKYETTLSLTDTLTNNAIYNHPLSIYHIPATQTIYTKVTQNGILLNYKQGNGMISFNAIPDGGNIILTKDTILSIEDVVTATDNTIETNSNVKLYPVPTTNYSTLKFSVYPNDTYSYKLLDINGRIEFESKKVFVYDSGVISEVISPKNKGFYILTLIINDQQKTLKLIVE